MRALTLEEMNFVSGGEEKTEVDEVVVTFQREKKPTEDDSGSGKPSLWDTIKDFMGWDGSGFGFEGGEQGNVMVGAAGVQVGIPVDPQGDIIVRTGGNIDVNPFDDGKVNVGPIGGVGFENDASEGWDVSPKPTGASATYTTNVTQAYDNLTHDGLGVHQFEGELYYGPAPGTPGGPAETSPINP